MLTHRGEERAKEPALPPGGASVGQAEIVFFTFDRAFGAGAGVLMQLPERGVSGDEGVPAIVVLRIGIDDAAIWGSGTTVGKEGTGGEVRRFLGGGQRTTPLDAAAVGTETRAFHRAVEQTYRDALFQAQWTRVGEMVLVTRVEWDNERGVPALRGEMVETPGIVRGIEGDHAVRQGTGFAGVKEGG